MCGIAGFVGGFVEGLVARMNAVQAHRGPDGAGVFEDPQAEAALGHVRLAVLDLTENAAQPMHSPDGRYVLSYNGEIYNFKELRRSLTKRGCTFKSTGDAEVLLQGLESHGAEFIERLDGMFAFALWDTRERTLLLARDHLGIKPLYYAEPSPGALIFASEIKALCAHPAQRREADLEVIQQHLVFCHAAGERTALKGVRRLPPGSTLLWRASTRTCELRRYWRPSFGNRPEPGREDAVRATVESLSSAVPRQLVSDVPVGLFLSGGLDSSFLASIAGPVGSTTLTGRRGPAAGPSFQCYTITYPPSENRLDSFDLDAPHARNVAREYGLGLVEQEIKPEVADLWPRLLWHLDEPIADPAAIACFLISRLARESGTPVLLSGQGADELFGGYPRYVAMGLTSWVGRLPGPVRSLLAGGFRLVPGAKAGRIGAACRRARRVGQSFDEPDDRRFLAYCANAPVRAAKGILSREVRHGLRGLDPFDRDLERMDEVGLSGMDRFLERDLSVYLPNHNLLYTDKMGMAVGLEARVPFLDVALVDLVTGFPARWKLDGRNTKVILRDAARGLVSDEVIGRPKAGFGAPFRKWLRHDLAAMWEDVSNERSVRERGWFDPRRLRLIRESSQAGREDLYMLQWAVLTIELWARAFLDRDPACASRPAHRA